MAHVGKTHLTYVIVSPPEHEAEGDRIFSSHGPWMASSHHRDGERALLSYHVSKGPELTNPMDRTSAPTGNVCYILTEVYESVEGVDDHFQQAMSGWQDFPALVQWLEKCEVKGVPAAPIINSLW